MIKPTEKTNDTANEKWNENVETCSDCGIHWKKRGKSCPVCYAPAEQSTRERKEFQKKK